MEQKNKVILCAIIYSISVFLLILLIVVASSSSHSYYKFGPSNDFYLISIKINTWERYFCALLVIGFLEVTKVIVEEIGMPVLGFSIYDPTRKIITEFTKNELQILANLMFFLGAIRYALSVMIIISQMDIAIFVVFIQQITSIFTIRKLLNEKKFGNNFQFDKLDGDENEIPLIEDNDQFYNIKFKTDDDDDKMIN